MRVILNYEQWLCAVRSWAPGNPAPQMAMTGRPPILATHAILLMERQRHPCRAEEGHFPEVHGRAPPGHPLPEGNQGAEGPGRDRPARIPGILELGREEGI